MTPAEEYAQKRIEAVELIQKHAPARLQDSLIDLLRPAIALQATRTEDSQIPIGASKFGGAPDVPPDFKWPMWNEKPLGFLAQINLGEVALFNLENLLPKSGVLAFFVSFDEEDPIIGDVEQFEGWRVEFYEAEGLHRLEPPANSHWIVPLHTQIITSKIRCSLPNRDERFDAFEKGWTTEEWEKFDAAFFEKQPDSQMLGHAYAWQCSPFLFTEDGWREHLRVEGLAGRNDDFLMPDALQWELLLQVETEADEFFDDIYGLGQFYFMIRRDDLAAWDFSKVWFNEQCT